MRIVMMGTGSFAVPTFDILAETDHQIVALLTSPIKVHRKGRAHTNPMRQTALRLGVPIHDPEDVNAPESIQLLRTFRADLHVVCDYGQILSAQALATARLGGINLHSSLLPKYRGAAPINWALYHGETETGVSVIHMTPKVDAGPVIAQSPPLPIEPEEDAVSLRQRLAVYGAWFVRRAIDALETGRLEAIPQDSSLASRAPRLRKEHGHVDWTRTAVEIQNHYRAMQPWPKSYTYWHRGRRAPLRLIVGPIRPVDGESPEHARPGEVVQASEGRLLVASGERTLAAIDGVQPAGKRPMTAAEFLRGYPIEQGMQFGPEDMPAWV